MKRITDFLDKWSTRIMFPLILIVFLKTCSTNGKIEKLEKKSKEDLEKFTKNLLNS